MEISVRDLKKTYDGFKLEAPSVVFPSGSVTALTGPNGKGKTTFLRILAGLDRSYTGEVAYDGKPLNGQVRRRMTMTFQTPMPLNRSVYANIEYPLKIRGIARPARKARVELLMATLSISHLAKKNAAKLSGGESQKAALARGLSLEPRILLLDEPFSAIDQQSIDDMIGCIAEYNVATGATVILVSHDNTHIGRLCNRIVEI
ncbi:MAG: ATP-binding cassette domain-containing protein [Clostridiales bacterium]|nr:ATP-binding cassette domain-containing protein [Clostridiales bacterium]